MTTKALDLFHAYGEDKLPSDGGYIVSSFLDESSGYSKYEIIAYGGLRRAHLSARGLEFMAEGNKLYVISEPASYKKSRVEPFNRNARERIPHRFSEIDAITSGNRTKIMVSRDPILTSGSFTITKPKGIDFVFLFYNFPEVLHTLGEFLEKTLNEEAEIPKEDSGRAAALIVSGLHKFTIPIRPSSRSE
jgi:hypothetical protein